MFRRKASIVGWSGQMRTAGFQEMSLAEFLNAHIKNNFERNVQLLVPFLYPEERVSSTDIVFVVRSKDSAFDTIVNPKRHVRELNHMKRLGIEMAKTSEAVKRVKLSSANGLHPTSC
ncbi:hypothetical protein BG011_001979 [Mortierella polycephala]|uniref:Uncharacterized protein n=1 Tax=Mortierella polycephala TaxID=41804 RepID=A0A9P6PKN4_9FUNG|nr:hypothetical protein BG011_001979 [Mortierella polycephala]